MDFPFSVSPLPVYLNIPKVMHLPCSQRGTSQRPRFQCFPEMIAYVTTHSYSELYEFYNDFPSDA